MCCYTHNLHKDAKKFHALWSLKKSNLGKDKESSESEEVSVRKRASDLTYFV